MLKKMESILTVSNHAIPMAMFIFIIANNKISIIVEFNVREK